MRLFVLQVGPDLNTQVVQEQVCSLNHTISNKPYHFGKYATVFQAEVYAIRIFIARQHTNALFLSRISIPTRDINIANLSVCPTVTFRNQMKTAQHIVIVFSPYGSPIVLLASNIFTQFRRGHPCGGAKYRWGIKNVRFSTNKSL